MTNFPDFFASLWKNEEWPKPEPFPWQTMLADRGANADWPEAIHLPTASGKTACLDAAIFGLAATADALLEKRMPRRIWFVVDRRIVVDEAFGRAKEIARKLATATGGPVKEVADVLRTISGTGRPLAVARLRGGAWRDDGWARLPSQPSIVCSTVDQVGSALLFRAYGRSDRTASIYAGLAAHDSLVLLDEAHCAVPFLQTLRAVARFRGEQWAVHPFKTPFCFSIMSATPPADIPEGSTFPRPAEHAAALDHPVLQQRFTARKLAALATVKGVGDLFIAEVASRAQKFLEDQGTHRVAVMVNRVATAEQIAEHLTKKLGGTARIVLLTGRMRPLDRDTLMARWGSLLKAGSAETPSKPVIVVTTQCLEVGADFSFDALVTECASLDALRQRFGRLNRLGVLRESHAVILIRNQDMKEPEDEDADPIYGKAIYETWKWLNELDQRNADGIVDFGIEAMEALVAALRARDEQRFERLLAPAPDAPILLPAHLDLLCQTSPRPAPDPDVTLFLHGKDRGAPEVRVVLRADLPDAPNGQEDDWLEILSLLPPTSPEMLTVPLHRLRRWLAEGPPDVTTDDPSGDVEGVRESVDEKREVSAQSSRVPYLLWRGRDRSEPPAHNLRRIRPDDVVVLRLTRDGLRGLGQTIEEPDGLGAKQLDLAERAARQARGRVMLRLQREVLAPWHEYPSVAHLLNVATAPEADRAEIEAGLQAVLDEVAATKDATGEIAIPDLPEWLRQTIQILLQDRFQSEDHPAGGLILTGRKQHPGAEIEDDPLADEDDLTSKNQQSVRLRQHTADVYGVASDLAARCLSPDFEKAFAAAARSHDLGKLDWRFQLLLRDGDEVEASPEEPLAKSARLPEGRRRRNQDREDSGLPKGFRHEFLSMQLAERFGLTPGDDALRDLTLHLIASHHGCARPFAPVVPDPLLDEGKVGDISLASLGGDVTLTVADRQALPPAHHLDSGVPDRFWRLTRRYGWWGLAYLEAIFRLADWEASRRPGIENRSLVWPSPQPPTRPSVSTIPLDGLDGANPLAFLAALGTLRVLARVFAGHDLGLSWGQRLGAWRPLLWTAKPLDEETIVAVLQESCLRLDTMFSPQLLAAAEAASPKNKKGEARWKDKLRFPIGALRTFCKEATALPSALAEFSATWAGETAPTGDDGENLAHRTRFDFTAGQQAFIRMIRELREGCAEADLRSSLFTGWRYSPTAVSMRWDIRDEKRQYALQAVDPTNSSENPPLADRGANFLAVEALPLFPLIPDRWASQPGFDRDADGRYWHWPMWTCPLSLDVIRSLLALPLADLEEWPPSRRRDLGISIVFQSGIVQPSGRYRCFTPAQSL